MCNVFGTEIKSANETFKCDYFMSLGMPTVILPNNILKS